MLGPRVYNPLLANHPSHRLSVRRHASTQGGVDHDLPISLLRLRLRHPILDLRLLAVPVTRDEPDARQPESGRLAQRPGGAVARQLRHSGHPVRSLWFHICHRDGDDLSGCHARARTSVAQYALSIVLDDVRVLRARIL